MRLYLIRHAQSANNAQPEHQRVEDPGLTPLGQQQASQLANWSAQAGITRLVTSPFRRALETTAPMIRSTGLVADVWVALHEQGGCYRGWDTTNCEGRPGMNPTEIRDQFSNVSIEPAIDERGWWRSQPYESRPAARKRAQRLEEQTRSLFGSTDETVAYVMHADFKRFLLETLFANRRIDNDYAAIFNTAVTCCELTKTETRLDSYNNVEHLDDHERTY